MSDHFESRTWWMTLTPEAQRAWVAIITGWTMPRIIAAAYERATNDGAPAVGSDVDPTNV